MLSQCQNLPQNPREWSEGAVWLEEEMFKLDRRWTDKVLVDDVLLQDRGLLLEKE